jgi:hypothetical protein
MMTNHEMMRQRRQIQRRIREVLAQRRAGAPADSPIVLIPRATPPDPVEQPAA